MDTAPAPVEYTYLQYITLGKKKKPHKYIKTFFSKLILKLHALGEG